MHLQTLFAAFVVASVASAHGLEGAPKLFGRRAVADLKASDAFAGLDARHAEPAYHAAPAKVQARGEKAERQNASGRCGSGFGNCAAGICCSGAGYCGTGKDYCAAPDCQFVYGPGCDANKVPAGATTANDARPKLGNVAYGGAGIYDCVTPGTVALTYDDGPYTFTNGMLDVLASYGAKATFFITGNNLGKGQIDNTAYPWASVIKRMDTEGHQLASHTWSHQDLSAITSAQRKNQMVYNEMALRNIVGKYPTYMRPPYSSCTAASGCEADMKTLGYIVSYFDLDTDDYNNVTPQKIQVAKNNFLGNISTGTPSSDSFLAIAHDIHEQTANNLTAYMLQTLQQKGYKAVTMGECLGDPIANWYRSSSGSTFSSSTSGNAVSTATSASTSSASAATATRVSTDATCGGTTGNTCRGSTFGNCCSVNGWCGSTDAYCGTGCQSGAGTCGSSSAVSSTAASSSTRASSSTVATSTRASSSTAASSTPSTSVKVSTDGTCGGAGGSTCKGSTFGNCCSQYGWCGTTTGHCSTGCQSAFGTCS